MEEKLLEILLRGCSVDRKVKEIASLFADYYPREFIEWFKEKPQFMKGEKGYWLVVEDTDDGAVECKNITLSELFEYWQTIKGK